MKKILKFKSNSLTKSNNIYLVICTLFLAIFGCVMVYSASFYQAQLVYGNKYYFLIKQIVGVVIGIFGFAFMSKFNYKNLQNISVFLLVISFVLLLCVFIPGLGVTNYGATRWINLGFFTFQPSEIAKFALVLWSSSYLTKNLTKPNKFKKVIPILFVGLLMCLLIMLEPNMSITICVGLIMLFMIFVSGADKKLFVCLGIMAVVAGVLLILLEPYRLKRLVAFVDPWANALDEGYQTIQSLYSLGNGGLFGVGLFNSRQKYLFLPFSESDFIFSIIGEEFGLVGVGFLMIVYATIIWQGIKIAVNSKDSFGVYLCGGIVAVISAQVLVNIAVVTNSIPPTGVPLPFISAGSTSIVVFMSAVGILNSVYKQNKMQNCLN